MSRFWGFRPGFGEFVLLANWRGSASCRRFDAESGELLSYETSGGVAAELAYGAILRECRALPAPEGVKAHDMRDRLPDAVLEHLRMAAGISVNGSGAEGPASTTGQPAGMLDGVDEIIGEALGLEDVSYRTKTAAARLSGGPRRVDWLGLVRRMYGRIEENWDGSEGRSAELWRWRAIPGCSAGNLSAEKTLEKAIIDQTRDWVNQIPAASGLLRDVEQRHLSVDLGRPCGPGWFELIELKVGENADTPLRAAFQILGYGLLYCFARIHRERLNLPVRSRLLAANRIDLKVLAPRAVYNGWRLDWVAEGIDEGVQAFSEEKFGLDLKLEFWFETFPLEFQWPGMDARRVLEMLERRKRYRAG